MNTNPLPVATLSGVLAVICALSWSIFSASRLKQKDSNSDYIAGNYLLGACVSSYIWCNFYQNETQDTDLSILMMYGCFAIVMKSCYLLWDYAMKKGDQQFVAVFSLLIPALAVGFLCIFGYSELTPSLILSLCLILIGIGLVRLNFRQILQTLHLHIFKGKRVEPQQQADKNQKF